jgi:class 3 adenylate cyclase/predicted ATPase
MDVGGWLRGLGLGQYEANFRDNKINAHLLPRLTNDDLKDIGVLALGDRLLLLDAIAALAGAKASTDFPTSQLRPAPPKNPPVSAERRPITVMFCDLVGSTSLAAKLDPEDWRNLVNAYLDEASAAVTSFGGHVLKKLGDGLMALFGYPQAQENDAERAVRAALAIQSALMEINTKNAGRGAPELSARIGVESGAVVVEASGEVFGDAPNIAARVQAAAEPGSVLITMNIQRQVAGLFVAEDQGARELKGVSKPVQLFRIVRASGAGRRSGARVQTPFVGREEEMGVLQRRWERARAGEGQFVLIVGEPGLGKSRLIKEFNAHLAETPHTWTEWSASQLLQNTPLHPVTEWGRLRFGADAPAEQRLADLEGTLRLIGLEPVEYSPLIAPLVDIPLPPSRVANFPAEELRRRQLAAMTAWFLAGARAQPVILIFEDLHWADPTSLDLVRALADRGAQAPLLLIATTRPEFRPPQSLRSHHSVVSLSPLDRAGVARMVGEITARQALSKELIEGVNERTGGVPLFIEEVTRLLLEGGEQGGVQTIPPTLQQSLAARLDRLGPAREIAQIGAVLGREFAYPLLRGIAEIDELTLQASLDRLTDADLLFVEGAPPQASYRFKHALIQDAAYDSLLKSRRQALHRRAAEILNGHSERAAAAPEVVAHHFTQAGVDDLAIEWWGKAGEQALRRSAFQEATAHLGKAIEMADKSAAVASQRGNKQTVALSQRMKLQSDYGQAVRWSKGFGADETKVAFDRAAELAATTEDFSERFAARNGQWTLAQVRGEMRRARELASIVLREAESAGRLMEVGVAHRGLAFMAYYVGNFLEARVHCEQALATCGPERDEEARERSGEDTGAVAMAMLALTSWQLGEVDRARELIEAANLRAAKIGHIPSMSVPLQIKCFFEILRGDPSATLIASRDLEALSRDHGMALQQIWAELDASWAHGRLHDPKGGAARLQQALAALAEVGNTSDMPLYLGLLAQLEADAAGVEAALVRVEEALAVVQEGEVRYPLAFLHRLRGDLLLKRDPRELSLAEQAFRAAVDVAKEQGARSYHLQAALPLAKLYRSAGRLLEAHAVLAPALEGFAPTPEMLEIEEAQALLAKLAENDEVSGVVEQRRHRLHLQTTLAHAVMWSKGFAADETAAAVARATELAAETGGFSEKLAAAHVQWTMAITRGELRAARELAAAMLSEAQAKGYRMEASVAHRGLALIHYFSGEFLEAQSQCVQALAECDPKRDREVRERFGDDVGTVVMSILAVTAWQLGEVDRARELIDAATRRALDLGHGVSKANPLFWRSILELLRGDAIASLSAADGLVALGQEHGMAFWRVIGEALSGWARGRRGDPALGAAKLNRSLDAHADQGARLNARFFQGLLAEIEAEISGAESGLARIDEALADTSKVDARWDLAFIHRLRGNLFVKRSPNDPAPAEDAYLTAIAIAKEQGARSHELLASLSLAKLYQSTNCTADAHAVLAPALEGFSPTPEMPEIAEAQALLAVLAETGEVRATIVERQRRLDLQTSYAQATMWAKGFAAEETDAAFARLKEFAGSEESAAARFLAYDAQCVRNFMRGELRLARETAETFLREAEADGRAAEAGAARRALGLAFLFQGELKAARSVLERALNDYVPERDGETQFRFNRDPEVGAAANLALAEWHLGEVERAHQLMNRAVRRAEELGNAAAVAYALNWKVVLESHRDDVSATRDAADAVLALTEERGIRTYADLARMHANWARGRQSDPEAGAAGLRQALAGYMAHGYKNRAPFLHGLLAELEAMTRGPDSALTLIDQGLAFSQETGEHYTDAYLHRLRGEVLLKRDPANPAPAEEAFQTALAIAKEQGARCWGLRASLSLAKLYQFARRLVEAHAVLAPALDGFSPTPEMPEIAEAQTLLAALAETEEVKAIEAQRQRRLV